MERLREARESEGDREEVTRVRRAGGGGEEE